MDQNINVWNNNSEINNRTEDEVGKSMTIIPERRIIISHSIRLMRLYGEIVTCYGCFQYYDKNAVFLYCEKGKLDIQGNIYICLNCSVYVDNIYKLRDWERHNQSELSKKCYRCNCNKSLQRFRKGLDICSYCVLKKKYVYLRKKHKREKSDY